MTSLYELQAAFQNHLLGGGGSGIARHIAGGGPLSRPERLGIYSGAYVARLVESLEQSYPALLAVLGEERFRSTARDFVRTHPSQCSSIRFYGRELADHLRAVATTAADAMCADLARWEWALAAAFDGPDCTPLPPAALANVPAARWPRLRLRLLGSLQRIATTSNAVDWWRAAIHDAPRPAAASPTPTTEWAAWRADQVTSFRSLPADEAWMLDAALRGRPFADLCAGLAEFAGVDGIALRAASLVKRWSIDGWITGVDTDGAADP